MCLLLLGIKHAGFFSVVKIIAILQLIMIALLLVFAYGVKAYTYYKVERDKRISLELNRLMKDNLANFSDVNLKKLMQYQEHVDLIIRLIHSLDASIKEDSWTAIREKIIDVVILPKARTLASSKEWSRRYLACQSFQLSLNNEDEGLIQTLVGDSVPLVAITAAMLAIRCQSQTLIDAIIDDFSKNRRVQQSLYAQALSSADMAVIPMIKNRLERENDPYIKAFCYRTLTSIPCVSGTVDSVNEDLKSTNIDLRLAVLVYLRHTDPMASGPLFLRLLKDSDWQVRAKSAKLLGELKDELFANPLEECLKDPQWWVRINAAEALAKIGEKGLSILRRQDRNVDQFAYDIAEQILAVQGDVFDVSHTTHE